MKSNRISHFSFCISHFSFFISHFTFYFLLFTFSLLIVSCGKDDEPEQDPNKVFTLGVILPLDQEKGELRQNALQLAIDEINQSRIGDGYILQLNVKSSAGADREVAAAAAAQQIKDESTNLIGFVTSFSSSTTGVVNEVGIPDEYPVISGSATTVDLSGVSGYFHRLCAPDRFEATILSEQALEYDINTVAIAVEDGETFAEGMAAEFKESFGIAAAPTVNFEINDPEYSNKLTLLLAGMPDAIFVSLLNPESYIEFFTELKEHSNRDLSEITFILHDGLYSIDFFDAPISDIIGEVNGHTKNFGVFPSANTECNIYKHFAAELSAHYQQEVASYNAQFYDIGYIYATAIERALVNGNLALFAEFRELVNAHIRLCCTADEGDTEVSPDLGWSAMKTIIQGNPVDYHGASGLCEIDEYGNAITPYALYKVVDNEGEYGFEIIKIIP